METVNTYIIKNVQKIDKNYLKKQSSNEEKKSGIFGKITAKIETLSSCKIFITPINSEVLDKAANVFKIDKEDYNFIVAAVDSSLTGNFGEGFVFTGTKIFYKEAFEKPVVFLYEDIVSAKYEKKMKYDKNGNEQLDSEYVEISLQNDKVFNMRGNSYCDVEFLSEFISQIIKIGSYQDENQLVPVTDMSDELKLAYVKIVVNMAFLNDDGFNSKKFAEVFLLMDKIGLDKDSKFIIMEYMSTINKENIVNLQELIEIIKQNSTSSAYKSIMISIIKDSISTYFANVDAKDMDKVILSDINSIEKNKAFFDLNDEDINLAFRAVKEDYSILNKNFDDETVKSLIKDLGVKASSVGVPLGALYISGSVVGLGATGITSGLATLGMGGVLGLSSMATGIGVVALIGVGTYQGVKHLTGANELSKYKYRELMLQEAIKQTQKSIYNVIDTINDLVLRINNAVLDQKENNKKIQKLKQMISSFVGAAKIMTDKQDSFQNSKNRLKCPDILDIVRLKNITSNSIHKDRLFDFIIKNYDKIEQDEETQYKLKDEIDTAVLEEMGEIFEEIGYFEVSSVIKSKVQDGFSNISNRVKQSFKNE